MVEDSSCHNTDTRTIGAQAKILKKKKKSLHSNSINLTEVTLVMSLIRGRKIYA